MFNNDLFSDVKFVVQTAAQGESESKQVIPAHKFVLSISSPVFEAMFYGELAETTDSIELPRGHPTGNFDEISVRESLLVLRLSDNALTKSD